MTACCVSGYRPLRGIRNDECHWPPTLAPAGPWEVCGCAEGIELGERLAAMAARGASGIMAPIAEAVAAAMKREAPTCSTCPPTDVEAKIIEWHEHWRTWLCPECGAVLGEECDG